MVFPFAAGSYLILLIYYTRFSVPVSGGKYFFRNTLCLNFSFSRMRFRKRFPYETSGLTFMHD
jgi:hypothetical protein